MALEDRGAQHDKVVVDKYMDPAGDYDMTTRDYVLRPYAEEDMTVVLPPVAEAKGRFYSIIARQAAAGATITITHRDDSECWLGDIVMDGPCDRVLLYSDGLAWHPLGAAGPGSWPGFSTTAAPGTTHVPTTAAPRQSTAPPTTTETTAAG